ncbi:FHA domain-containing protein [Longispora sp. NPDC051575]|uniref:FHA domain-containing protein n=1 Tax=Longispora sp. NPDC051575 TaxID=3154943 RepID=UPI0034336558
MPTCPNGHESADADYCDVCGALIGGAARPPSGAPQGGVSPSPAVGAGTSGQSSSSSSGPTGTAASGHVAGAADGRGPGPAPGAAPAADAPCPECGDPRTGRFCETCGYDFTASGTPPRARPAPATQGQAPQPPAPGPTPGQWSVTVTADRAYHRAVADRADDDSEEVPFPAYCPERRFALTGGQLLIGRRSRSRGIVPDIDLTGPPEDTGVSHVHALLVATADGWELVDPGSTNGTRLNGAEDPLAENTPVPLSDGDRIHVGAWTTITVHAA